MAHGRPEPADLHWEGIEHWGPERVRFPREGQALGLGYQVHGATVNPPRSKEGTIFGKSFRATKAAVSGAIALIKSLGKLTPLKTLVALMYTGRANRHWYEGKVGYHEAMTAHSPDPADRVRHTLLSAVFSPNGPVIGAENATNLAYQAWQSGATIEHRDGSRTIVPSRTKDPALAHKLMASLFEGEKHGVPHFPEDFAVQSLREKPIAVREQVKGDPALGKQYSTRVATLSGEYLPVGRAIYGNLYRKAAESLANPEQYIGVFPHVGISGQPVKINHYFLSSLGVPSMPVTDTHHQQILNFPAKNSKGKNKVITEKEYHLASLGTNQAAFLLNPESGHQLNPEPSDPHFARGWHGTNGQAAAWAVNRALYGKFLKNPSLGAEEALRSLTHKDIYEAADLHHLVLGGKPAGAGAGEEDDQESLGATRTSRELMKLATASGTGPADLFDRMNRGQANHQPPEQDFELPAVHPDHLHELIDFTNQVKGRVIKRIKGREKGPKKTKGPALPGMEDTP